MENRFPANTTVMSAGIDRFCLLNGWNPVKAFNPLRRNAFRFHSITMP